MALHPSWQPLKSVQSSNIIVDETQQSIYAIHCTQGLLQYSFDKNTWNIHPIMNNLPINFFPKARLADKGSY